MRIYACLDFRDASDEYAVQTLRVGCYGTRQIIAEFVLRGDL